MTSVREERPDVLVLGGGCAGALAAVTAARAGHKVLLVAKGGGATGMSSGAIDVADATLRAVPGPDASPLDAGPPWAAAMEALARERPRHPYARVGEAGRARMDEALELLGEVAAAVPFVRRDGRNLVLATQLGTTKRAAMVQASCGLDLSEVAGRTIGLLDVRDVAGWDARPVARMLRWLAQLADAPLTLRLVEVKAALGGRPAPGPGVLAARLAAAEARAAFLEAVAAAVGAHSPPLDHLLLPPILGREAADDVREELERKVGLPVSELLALPQSAPGARLQAALLRGLDEAGVERLAVNATAAEVVDGRVVEVSVLGEEGVLKVKPRAVVLATGRFLAGGLVRDGEAREPVFGLPLVADGRVVADRFIGELTADRPEGEHAIFRAGVAYDDLLRPRAMSGSALAENLFAAGSVLEGYDPARDGSGMAVAALTGLLAGERAAAAAAE